jgi:hypothetical protein
VVRRDWLIGYGRDGWSFAATTVAVTVLSIFSELLDLLRV